jgi:two-component system sensor histidine kinase/response regulator
LSEEKRIILTACETFLNNTTDYVFVKDSDLIYRTLSRSVATMAGFQTADELVGKDDYSVFPKELAEKYRADDRRVLETGLSIEGEIERLPDKDGSARFTQTWKYVIRDKDGKARGLYGISRDCTHTIELENAAENAKNYSDIIDNIPGGIGILHCENGVFFLDFANDGCFAAQHNTRESWEKYMGGKVMNAVYEHDRKAVEDEYLRVKDSDGGTGSVSYRVKGADGGLYWVHIQFREAYVRGGIKYYYASFTDINEQKTAERQLRESREQMKEAISYSTIQYFTYFPDRHRAEIYALCRRMAKLPMIWDNYPESFFAYTKPSVEDRAAFSDMVKRINSGADEAGCTVRLEFDGVWLWEKVHMTAVRDDAGRTIKAQAYAIDVTEQKDAEERLREERLRQRALEGDIIEAFSFNVTKNTQANLQSSDEISYNEPISSKVSEEAERIAPPTDDGRSKTRTVLLSVASQIPDRSDRELFLGTCGRRALQTACEQGRYENTIRYRRHVGSSVRWVSTQVEVLPDPDTGDLVAFFYTRDINEEVIAQKISEQIIKTNYVAASYCEVPIDRIHLRFAGDDGSFGDEPYDSGIDAGIRRIAAENEREWLRRKLALGNVVKELEKNNVYSLAFTGRERDGKLSGKPQKRLKSDAFYLDDNRDVIVMLLTDVTTVLEQERDVHEKMAEALAAAEQASVAKTEFLSRMSHEIRTPMNAIIGLDAIALQEKGLSSSMEDHLQKIGISARFLLSLINDILDMSRIESGRMMLKNEPFNFEELIDGINTIMYEQCRDNELDYDCVLKSFTEEMYVGDKTKLQQVLVNILGNAVKFTPNGGKIHFMVEQVSRTKNKARLRFEISDTGIGIDEKFIPHLFEAFSQENRGRTSAYGGTGLGLSISKNIVALMGGDITVHSIKNVGSEFTVEVSLGLTKESARRRELLTAGKILPLFTLVVDDDVIVCQHTQMLLEGSGLKAEWVDSGAGAVTRVTDHHKAGSDYDLILLDWKMPDMDGIETAREIRKVVGPEVTIIIMTAYDWADIEKRAKAAGVDMFMKKPVFASSVTKAFENVFVKKRSDIDIVPVPEIDFAGKRVLLAEDNEINAEIAKNLLEIKKCAVDIADNGAVAIETFTTTPVGYYDAILMDIRMPIMDGLEATKVIRAMKKADSATVPIIAMTANAFQEDVKMSLDSGMNAHLAKPIDPVMLYDTLAKYFGKTQIN